MTAPPLVAFRGVTRRFPGVLANDAVSFELYAGEVHVLLGENGAGKSTLIAMLAGVQRPDEGEIVVAGAPVHFSSPHTALALGIGTVFQHGVLVPTLTVTENLLLGGPWWQWPRRQATRARFRDSCASLGLAIDPDAIVGTLALADRQMVEVVRALWRGGRVLVLDEPTALLTPQASAELGALMRRVAAHGVAVVFITHKLAEALDVGDQITVLRRGRVVERIRPETVRATPRAALATQIVSAMFGTAEPATPPSASASVGAVVLAAPGLAVRAGEVFGIAGIDGNGQRELAEQLAGQADDGGAVRLGGGSLAGLGVAARTAAGLRYLTDDRVGEGSVGVLSLTLNLLLKRIGHTPFWRRGLSQRREMLAHLNERIRDFDIRAATPAQPAGTLSGGNLQKLLLARELDGTPRAVIYNKPTAGLDVRSTQAAWARIRAAASRGVAAVLISSDLDEILALSDRIGVMRRGVLVGVVNNDAAARAAVGHMMAGDAYG